MQDNSAKALMGYLFDQLDMLAAVDMDDAGAVETACKVAKAVNDTAKNVIDLSEVSMKAAMLNSSAIGRIEVPAFFLEGGEE